MSPTTPQYAAGRRIEPPVWVPIAAGTCRAATAAADPDDDPPGVCAADHGLRVGAGSLKANCVVWVFPTMTAPAARSRATAGASAPGVRCANDGAPARVGSPATSMMSLIPTGTPWSAPTGRPAATSPSRSRACARAPSASTATQARSRSSVAAMRARQASTTSVAVNVRSRMASTVSTTPRSVGSGAVTVDGILAGRDIAGRLSSRGGTSAGPAEDEVAAGDEGLQLRDGLVPRRLAEPAVRDEGQPVGRHARRQDRVDALGDLVR